MNEAVSKSIMIFVEGYPTMFLATVAFFIMIKLLMKSASRKDAG
ncbi:hypothetical protein Theba_2045 [Mesotoga prima MesG1.Ag.4.2]|jgi:hypothetical protein|uniref:Uncharacterized protein n=1 Tax=Mesotoga prima MesG1.Ag.4.2 TaxID=660470 RepID=I2F6Y3_9BACT|nr:MULTISPECIES: hypothetical protein [Mesotoga]AFK07686.1 hypothetical protein Theba_2045 [Mesotoga prima MesG1.Ag.4.2]